LRRLYEVAGSFGAHPVVTRGELGKLIDSIREVGELVHHDVGRKGGYRGPKGVSVEYIADDRRSSQPGELIDLAI
jgi:hypothetical protein